MRDKLIEVLDNRKVRRITYFIWWPTATILFFVSIFTQNYNAAIWAALLFFYRDWFLDWDRYRVIWQITDALGDADYLLENRSEEFLEGYCNALGRVSVVLERRFPLQDRYAELDDILNPINEDDL